MVPLTRLNQAPMVLNSDLIEHIDVTPDTVITLTTGQILGVRETVEEVVDRVAGASLSPNRRSRCVNRLLTDWYADNSPTDTNDTDEGRAHNRRVNLVLLTAGGMAMNRNAADPPAILA